MMIERARGGRVSGSGAPACDRAGKLAGPGHERVFVTDGNQARGDTVSRPRLNPLIFFSCFFILKKNSVER
jgi:hypothetical protein